MMDIMLLIAKIPITAHTWNKQLHVRTHGPLDTSISSTHIDIHTEMVSICKCRLGTSGAWPENPAMGAPSYYSTCAFWNDWVSSREVTTMQGPLFKIEKIHHLIQKLNIFGKLWIIWWKSSLESENIRLITSQVSIALTQHSAKICGASWKIRKFCLEQRIQAFRNGDLVPGPALGTSKFAQE